MSIKLFGNLNVEQKTGRYGEFNVCTINTELGTFSVKDKTLEQYKPGKYEGEFIIDRIQAESSTSSKGGFFVKTSAWLSDFVVNDNEPVGDVEPDLPIEQDPIEQDKQEILTDPVPLQLTAETQVEQDTQGVPVVQATEADQATMDLFGLLWPLGDEVRLDATVSREILRSQAKYLGDHDYEYKPRDRVWVKK